MTQYVMAVMDLFILTATTVLKMLPRMNTELVTVIGSGRA